MVSFVSEVRPLFDVRYSRTLRRTFKVELLNVSRSILQTLPQWQASCYVMYLESENEVSFFSCHLESS